MTTSAILQCEASSQRRAGDRESSATLFWSRVDKSSGCWVWTGSVDRDGYGKFCISLPRDGVARGAKMPQRYVRAHRYSFELAHGPDAVPRVILHLCDNPRCVRPDHLAAGTHAENIADRVSKNRSARGSNHGLSKLTDADVIGIRTARASGESLAKIADRHGVDKSTVWRVCTGRAWTHVADAASHGDRTGGTT